MALSVPIKVLSHILKWWKNKNIKRKTKLSRGVIRPPWGRGGWRRRYCWGTSSWRRRDRQVSWWSAPEEFAALWTRCGSMGFFWMCNGEWGIGSKWKAAANFPGHWRAWKQWLASRRFRCRRWTSGCSADWMLVCPGGFWWTSGCWDPWNQGLSLCRSLHEARRRGRLGRCSLWWGKSWPGWVSRAGSDSCPPAEPGPGKFCLAGSVEAFDASEEHWWGRSLTRLSDRSLQLHRVPKLVE